MKLEPQSWIALIAIIIFAINENWNGVAASIALSVLVTVVKNLWQGNWQFALLVAFFALIAFGILQLCTD